ncbi:hypothetical protein [Streptomyces viridochromogenes]|uniref:hypothetical protein n=1 Tax=Streptomyces viridochromogenes TaxID=1938 RepID=UPI000A47D828|nr:hypothetical protein [Streptomyces viridochromogenes]
MREIHAGSSPVDADHSGGHNPRPPITIRQHARRAAMVGCVVGPDQPSGPWFNPASVCSVTYANALNSPH